MCRTYNGFDINFTEDYFRDKVLLPILQNYKKKEESLSKYRDLWESTKEDTYLKIVKKIYNQSIIPNNVLLSGNQKDGRGNIVPETIVLPVVAMLAKKKCRNHPETLVETFLDLLDRELVATRDELIRRFDWICAQDANCASLMWENNTMKGYEPSKGIRSAMIHGTLAIGQLGIAETLQILIGKDHTTKEGMELAKRIEQKYKDFCTQSKETYKLNFGNYYTPAESLCGTAYKYFLKKYGLIENVTAYKNEEGELKPRGFFTNSIHVPVWTEIDPYKKIDIESQLTGYSSAGCITYVEIGDNAVHNLPALADMILYAKSKDVPYFAINVKLSACNKCGYVGYIPRKAPCPVCNADHKKYVDDFARITGYLSLKVQHFNDAKQDEEKWRYVNVDAMEGWVQSETHKIEQGCS